jgi:hypothetical protein
MRPEYEHTYGLINIIDLRQFAQMAKLGVAQGYPAGTFVVSGVPVKGDIRFGPDYPKRKRHRETFYPDQFQRAERRSSQFRMQME